MANSIGRLVVELAASTAKFQSDLGKAAREAEIASKRISTAFSFVKGAVAGAAGAFSIAAFANIVKGSIDAADHLNDLSQRTGVAVETLSGLGLAAKQSGTDLDTVAKAFGKLNLSIAAGAAGNEESLRTFKALGISMADLGRLTPSEVFARVADKFESWNDGANKAAIGNKLFGKSYQDVIPLLNQGGEALRKSAEYAEKYGGVTTEVARQADEFNDTLEKLKFQSQAFGRTLASELLKPLQALSNEFLKAQENGNDFQSFAKDVATILKSVASVAVVVTNEVVSLGEALGAIAAEAAALARLDLASAREISRLNTQDEKERDARRDRLLAAINNPPAATIGGKTPPKKKTNPPSLGTGEGSAEDTAKRILDAQLKQLDRSISEERELLGEYDQILKDSFDDGLITVRQFYQRRQQVIDQGLAHAIAAYDEEAALVRQRLSTPGLKETERISSEEKLADITNKRQDVERKAALASRDNFRDSEKAAQGFRDSIEEVSIQLSEMRGDAAAATLARFQKAHAELRRQISNTLDSGTEEEQKIAREGQEKLNQLERELELRDRLSMKQRDFSLELAKVGNAQARIDIARRTGALTELEALQKVGEASQSHIAKLKDELAAARAIADQWQDPAALQAVDDLKLKIEELAASTDLVAKKFNDIFVNSLSDAITDFATGAKSFKDIIKDLEKSIVGGISRIASQNIAETLFKPENLGGVGGFFADLFGFGKGKAKDATGGAALTSAGATLTTAGTTMTTAATTLLTASASLQAAAVAMGASGLGSNIASAFMPGGFSSPGVGSDVFSFFGFANGGSPPIGKASLVGERGPELFIPRQSGTVIPNEVLSAKRAARTVNQTVNINLSGTPNTKTLDQMAVEVGRATRRAMARNS